MSSEVNALIHIGYQKAASTWLQKDVFPAFEDVDQPTNVNRTCLALKWNAQWDAEESRRRFGARDGRSFLLTDENLCGDPWRRIENQRRNIQRLHELFPSGRVLVIVRRQQDAASSLYSQYVRMGGDAPLDTFIEGDARPGYDPDHLRYDRLCRAVEEEFGAEALTVVPMELLEHDVDRFWGLLAAWRGTPVATDSLRADPRNVRLTDEDLHRLRVWNRYVRRSEFSPRGLLRDDRFDELTSLVASDEFTVGYRRRRRHRSFESGSRRCFLAATSYLHLLSGDATRPHVPERHVDSFRASNRALQAYSSVPLEPLGYVL
jgi:hypothetical protein